MRKVIWEDRNGWKRASLVRDGDPDSAAPSGIPLEVADTSQVDCEAIAREINNLLVSLGISTWNDVLKKQKELDGLFKSVVKRQIIPLLKNTNKEV